MCRFPGKQVISKSPTHCLLLFAIEAEDLLDLVKKSPLCTGHIRIHRRDFFIVNFDFPLGKSAIKRNHQEDIAQKRRSHQKCT